MLVTISRYTSGTCVWCCKQTDDGVEAQFQDGLSGFLCWPDFKKAVKARSGSEQPSEPPDAVARSDRRQAGGKTTLHSDTEGGQE
jgi:hypothetical protein